MGTSRFRRPWRWSRPPRGWPTRSSCLPSMIRRGKASLRCGTVSREVRMVELGDRAPPLTLSLSDGSAVDLAAPGSPLVVYFYPKDDTSGCTREAQDFTALADDFKAAGVRVIGVSRDPMKKHDKFIGKYGLAVPLASDEDGRISDAFGTWVEKSMYGRKYMGMERATFLIGADGRVLRAWRKVKVPGHAAEVLDAAKEFADA